MRISVDWLKAHLESAASADEISEKLTSAGLNVAMREGTGDDEAWDVEVTTNRPDAMNHYGMAREAATAGCGRLQPLRAELVESSTPIGDLARLSVQDEHGCPRYCARVIRGVRVGPSPEWLVKRLERAGVRSINNVVDATNYVLLDVGQPLHAFDLAYLSGSEIRVRKAHAGEVLTTLDGVDRQLQSTDVVIADGAKGVALAGIMGGANSEISEKTRDVLIESAYFDPRSVRLTARRLGLKTEASHRFERGADRAMARTAVDLVMAMIVELAGGDVAAGVLDSAPKLPEPHLISISLARLSAFTGHSLPQERVFGILAQLGLNPVVKGDSVTCTTPTYRVDIELAEDIYEEVLRHYGYDNIPSALPVVSTEPGKRLGAWPVTERARDALCAAGLAEAFTYAFVSVEQEAALAHGPLAERGSAIVVDNPLSARLAVMRRSVLAGLVDAAATNLRRGAERVMLGEVGRAFFSTPEGVREEERLAVTLAGKLGAWDAIRPADFVDLKGYVEGILAALGITNAEWKSSQAPILAPGLCAEIVLDGRVIGLAGLLAEAVATVFDAPSPIWVAEIDLACSGPDSVPKIKPVPRFPSVSADLTIRHKLSMHYADLVAAIGREGPEWLESISPVVRYQGEGVGADEVKTTVRLVYRSGERSLTQEEVNTAHFALMDHLAAALGISFQ